MNWRRTILAIFLLPVLANATEIRVRILRHAPVLELSAERGRLRVGQREWEFSSAHLSFLSGGWRLAIDGMRKRIPFGSLELQADSVRMNSSPIPSDISLKARLDHTVDVIASMPLEDYLRGVVPAEMPASWPSEALKAQAVAARSFAYRRIMERRGLDFDVESNIADQKFTYAPSDWPERTNDALSQTNGLILYRGKDVFEALYHADCGGTTENANNVWGGDSQTTSHPDCPHPTHHWRRQFDGKFITEKMTAHFGLSDDADVRSIEAVGRSAAGRIKDIRIDLGDGSERWMSSQEFRKLLGFKQVPSTHFTLSWDGNLHLAGLGEGHGVGMCQMGARSLAAQGKGFRDILSFYYPNARLDSVAR